jgi:hypothetical protein
VFLVHSCSKGRPGLVKLYLSPPLRAAAVPAGRVQEDNDSNARLVPAVDCKQAVRKAEISIFPTVLSIVDQDGPRHYTENHLKNKVRKKRCCFRVKSKGKSNE